MPNVTTVRFPIFGWCLSWLPKKLWEPRHFPFWLGTRSSGYDASKPSRSTSHLNQRTKAVVLLRVPSCRCAAGLRARSRGPAAPPASARGHPPPRVYRSAHPNGLGNPGFQIDLHPSSDPAVPWPSQPGGKMPLDEFIPTLSSFVLRQVEMAQYVVCIDTYH